MISIINSPYLCGKPPSLLRDSGSKNPIFSWKSAFLKKEKTWSHMISKILRCALFLSNQRFWGKKNSKTISTRPSLKFAKNGRPEPLWTRGFSVQMLCALLLKAFTVVLPSKTCRAYLRLHAYACNRPKCGKMRQNAAHVAMLRLLKETWGNSFSAVWAARKPSKAAFFTEFQIKHVWTYCAHRFFEKTNFSAPRQKGAISHTQNDPRTPRSSSYPSG